MRWLRGLWFKRATCDVCDRKAVSAERGQFRCRKHDRKIVEAGLAQAKACRDRLRKRKVVVVRRAKRRVVVVRRRS